MAIERQLLTDPEVLLDYLDLKRSLECASAVPQEPSEFLWAGLQSKSKAKRKLVFSLSFAAAAAVIVIVALNLSKQPPKPAEIRNSNSQEILFDSISEPIPSSSVL